MICSIITACKKDNSFSQDELNLVDEIADDAISPTKAGFVDFDPEKKIVLGKKREIPYQVPVLEKAWKNLYNDGITISQTHNYMRFLPDNFEDLAVLLEAFPDINFSDYPLEYEIDEDGGWYHDPTISEDKITWLYAAIPVDATIPDVPHEIIEEVALLPRNSRVVAEAYRLTGNVWNSEKLRKDGCEPSCPNWPDCDFDTNIPCGGETSDTGGDGDPPNLPMPCTPDNPLWPDCLMVEVPAGTIGGGGDVFESTPECGCQVFSNTRKPGGCVAFEDTQLGIKGVKNVKVIVRDDFLTENSTFTDMNGCWRLPREHSGWIKITVKFKSSRITVRGINQLIKFWEYSEGITLKTGKIWGPVYNNIFTQTFMAEEQVNNNTFKHRWYAAHANNSVYEYDDFATQENMTSVPDDIDVLVANFGGTAAAPMLDDMSHNPIISLGLSGLISGALNVSINALICGFFPPACPISSTLFILLSDYIVAFAPDVVYAYKDDITTSDDIMETFYHEYAHAAHYDALNNDLYWLRNIKYTADNATQNSNPPYGTGNDPESGRTAIIESFAAHIGYQVTDNFYQTTHSNDNSSSDIKRWIYHRLETFDPTDGSSTGSGANIGDAWIPEGVYWDCMDNNNDNPMEITDPVTEIISGYTNAQIMQAVSTNAPTEVQAVRDFLKSDLPTGVTPTLLDNLFSTYGYN